MFGTSQTAQTIVPERWHAWAEKCRAQTPRSRPYFTAVLAMFEESAARWIEDSVPDSTRAIRIPVQSDDHARQVIIDGLNGAFNGDQKKAMVSAWLCRDYNGASSIESDPMASPTVRLLIRQGRAEGW